MTNVNTGEGTVPPYVSYRTFANFVNGFRQGVPSRIDKSVMTTVAGSVQAQLRTALRYLELIDENGRTQDAFRQLAQSDGIERQQALRSILEKGYPFLLANDEFELTATTPAEFTEQFKKQGAQGDTVRKCELFFLSAAKDAGIAYSDRIEPKTSSDSRSSSRAKPASPKRQSKPNPVNHSEVQAPVENSSTKSTSAGHVKKHTDELLADYEELRSFIGKLPRSKQWTRSKRDRWLRALTSMLDWEVEIIDENSEDETEESYEP